MGKTTHMREPMPRLIEPMLAVAGALPTGADAANWGYELKWDGVRAVTYVAGSVRATGRRGHDITGRYPELEALGDLLGQRRAVLDGEVVAFGSDGRPSFELLQRRMHVARASAVAGLTRRVPVTYVLFDILHLDGERTMGAPYTDRRTLLESVVPPGETGAAVYVPEYFRDGGAELLEATGAQGLEGLVAKRLDSAYLPGQRARTWRKVKHTSTREVVIAGWKPGQGARAGGIGSLLLGVYDQWGLRYIGHVGTGFTERALADLERRLRPLQRSASPYVDEIPREFARQARWVEPRLVGEVAYESWTRDGRLRAPSWRGLREDVPPEAASRDQG